MERLVRSARLEEYPFRRALAKPHSLPFGQIFVREHRRAVSQGVSTPFLLVVVGVLPAGRDVALERVPFLDQLIHAL